MYVCASKTKKIYQLTRFWDCQDRPEMPQNLYSKFWDPNEHTHKTKASVIEL